MAGGAHDTDVYTPNTVPTLVHCVFCNYGSKGNVRAAISPYIHQPAPVLSNIVHVDTDERGDLRTELGIPSSAIVIGRYGGMNTFNVPFVVDHVAPYARAHPDVYFLFMNTRRFTTDPAPSNILFLPASRDVNYKTKFVRTCDAMLHARADGETHGMACGEFALLGRPVITTRCGATAHIDVYLKDAAIVVNDTASLNAALSAVRRHQGAVPHTGYHECTPDKVMPQFKALVDLARQRFFEKSGNGLVQ